MSQRIWCIRRTLLLALLIAISANFGLARSVSAQAGEPPTPSGPIQPLADEAVLDGEIADSLDSLTAGQGLPAGLPAMKAVLVVAPLAAAGADPNWISRESAIMDKAAAELQSFGVSVQKLYGPNAKWSELVKAARGASFLLYRGDGVQWPNGNFSGFYLTEESINGTMRSFFSGDDIRRELALARNAIVMIYACWSAGSASNEPAPSTPVAFSRVAQYSDPFFDIGAAGYYANWQPDGFQLMIRSLFQGKTLGDTYLAFPETNTQTVEKSSHPDHPGLSLWLDYDYLWNSVQFDNAFSGKAGQTLFTLNDQSFMPRVFIPFARK